MPAILCDIAGASVYNFRNFILWISFPFFFSSCGGNEGVNAASPAKNEFAKIVRLSTNYAI